MKKLYIIYYILIPLLGFTQNIPTDSLSNEIYRKNNQDSLLILLNNNQSTDSIFTNYINIERKLSNIQNELIEKGYIFNRLYPVKIVKTDSLTHIYYQAKLNNLKTIDTFIYISDRKFPSNLKRHIERKYKNATFNQENILKINNFIQQYYNPSKKEILQGIYRKKTAILIKTKAARKNAADAYLGLKNLDGKTSIEGKVDLKLTNIFNQNEIIKFDWQKNENNQSLSVFSKFPYLSGSNLFLQTDHNIINQKNKNLELNLENSVGYMTDRQSFGLKINYVNKIFDKKQTAGWYYGISHKLFFKKQYKELINFDLFNSIQTEIDIIPKENKSFLFYNEIGFTQKLFRQNFINFTNFIQTGNHEILKIKNSYNDLSFKTFNIEEVNYKQIIFSQLKYMYALDHYIFYGVLKFDYKKKIDNSLHPSDIENKSLQSGLGVNFSSKNQILTFEIIYANNIGLSADYQYFKINILNKIRF